MSSQISDSAMEAIVEFHGHSCPGLVIGVRAAELAMEKLEYPPDTDMVTVAETDMCGVDAIQFLTGCTLGKGNLIMLDHGKMAFTFFRRSTGKGFRALLNPEVRGDLDDDFGRLMQKSMDGSATDEEEDRLAKLRVQLKRHFMSLDLGDMFMTTEWDAPPPRPARVLTSLKCEDCGEMTMESRTRRFGGQTLCLPCFLKVEQKI
ncbi:MAG: formylmethanofuran dehydrogenase [Desulfovibrio sp.]|nr:MAG: formylmethanofuran dehydrogenase [Desulfovibrio sp.]